MIGAIIGDIVGSRFEFNNIKTKDFELFSKDSCFTDDTVMTIAVADWAMNAKDHANNHEAALFLKKWGKKYPNAGYGGRFYYWVLGSDMQPYNSYGNGSAMRISPIGCLYVDEKEMLDTCRIITGVTHNHPEGMKGAETVAMMIFKAKNGATKKELRDYAESMYPEIKNLDYEELRRTYTHGTESCQLSVPQALYCFLISNDFEDCIRTTISIGGDCDTTAAMSGAIAEAFYKDIPEWIIQEAMNRLTLEMRDVVKQEYKYKKVSNDGEDK